MRAELPLLRGLARDLRMANWKVNVTLEMRDWVYGTYLPPRILRVYPSAFGQRGMAWPSTSGTTIVVAYLVDFDDRPGRGQGQRLQRADRLRRGRDLPHHLRQAQGRAARLQHLVVETINDLIDELRAAQPVEPAEIHEVAVAGNTTMTHLLLGLDPQLLRRSPTSPGHAAAQAHRRMSSAWTSTPQARVHCLPAVGSYVGGDITAGVICSGLTPPSSRSSSTSAPTARSCWAPDWLVTCACSAGPAFEGGGVARHARDRRRHRRSLDQRRDLEPTYRVIATRRRWASAAAA